MGVSPVGLKTAVSLESRCLTPVPKKGRCEQPLSLLYPIALIPTTPDLVNLETPLPLAEPTILVRFIEAGILAVLTPCGTKTTGREVAVLAGVHVSILGGEVMLLVSHGDVGQCQEPRGLPRHLDCHSAHSWGYQRPRACGEKAGVCSARSGWRTRDGRLKARAPAEVP